MPQAATLDQTPDELDSFVQSYKSAAPKPSVDDDELDSFVKQYQSASPQSGSGSKVATPDVVAARANRDGVATGKAVESLKAEGYTTAPFPKTDPRSHDFGWSKDEDGNWTQDPAVAERDAAPAAQSTIPITPFQATVPTTPLDQRAAKLGQPSIQLEPPPADTSKIPLNEFTNTAQRPPTPEPTAPTPAPPKNSMDEILNQEQAFEGQANQQADKITAPARALASRLQQGSKNVPLPYFHPDGSVRTMKLGDFEQLASDYLNDATQSKGHVINVPQGVKDAVQNDPRIAPLVNSVDGVSADAFAAGMAADVVKTLNDIYFSPLGMASTVTGLASARALQLAGKDGTAAIKLAQEYQAMKNAGASEAELASQANLIDQRIAAVGAKQRLVIGATRVQQGVGDAYAAQGADSIIHGIQRKDYSQIAAGIGGLALGVRSHMEGSDADVSNSVKAQTAKMATEGLESEPEPVAAQAEKNVTGQASHEIVRPPQLPESVGDDAATVPRQASDETAPKVGAGEELTPEKPETLKAQVDALAGGTNSVVYIPAGQKNAPEPPNGAQVTEVSGDKPGAGTYYHDESVTPQEIKSAVKDGTYGQLLGNVQSKAEATAANAPVAVTARTDDGTEAKASVVDGSRPDAIAAQTAELQRQFPKATVGVETPEQVVEGRQSTQAPTAPQTAASRETPQAGEEDEDDIDGFVQRHREARAVIEPEAQELRGLAGKVKDIDPHTADALNGLADGRYFSREDLLKIAGGIRNAKTSKDLTSIVNDFAGTEGRTAPNANVQGSESAKSAPSAKGTERAEAASPAAESVSGNAEQVRGRTESARPASGEGRDQLGPQAAPAKVGDRVVAKSGKLQGKPIEVTKVGATGVYGQEENGGPIRFFKTGDFGPLLDSEGKPITTGPGTPLRDAFDTAGTRIQQLADVIRENVSGSKPINERMDYADKVAEQKAKAKDATDSALGKVRGAMAAMWDAYTRPPKWTDYEDALGKYQGAVQKSAFGLKHFAAEIKKAVPDPIRREGITNFIEAGGDRATMEKWAKEGKSNRRPGYRAALSLTNVEQTIARNIIATQDERYELDKAAGLLEHEVENYVMHAWKRENPYTKKLVSNVRAQMLQTKPSFTKQRVFGTFFDGEKAGYAPVNKDIGFLFAAREHAADQAIAARAFIKSMLEGKASDGRPLVTPSGAGKTIDMKLDEAKKAYFIDPKIKPEDAADYRIIDHPALRKWTWADNDSKGDPIFVKGDLVVHPEAYDHLKNVLGKSALRSWAPFHAMQAISSHFKATELSFSMFHQNQESLHAIFHRVNPTSTKPIDFSNPKQIKLIDHGLQVASFDAQQAFGEGLGAGVPNRLPIIGKYLQRYNEYLFGDFIPRLKMSMAQEALGRNLKRYQGKISDDQIYALTANQANAAFGELNYTMLGRNKTMQDIFRMLGFAPDFFEARARFAGQALKPYGTEQLHALLIGALGLYAGARIINAMLNKGNPHWEPQNAFDVVYKGKSYTLRSVPADIEHLFTDPRGFIYNRLNPIYGRGAIEAITGRDKYGHKQSAGQQVKDLLAGGLPIPAQGLLKKSDTGGVVATLLGSTGLSTFPYKSPAERLAQKYTLDSMPLGEESKDRKDANHLARELEDKLRKKEISPREVKRAYQEGEITASDRKRILARAARTPLQNSFRSLTPQQAIEVWDKANPDEQKQIRPLLANKLSRLGSVPQSERSKLKERIFTALHGSQKRISEKGVPFAPVSR